MKTFCFKCGTANHWLMVKDKPTKCRNCGNALGRNQANASEVQEPEREDTASEGVLKGISLANRMFKSSAISVGTDESV